jgi:hypothetical protein
MRPRPLRIDGEHPARKIDPVGKTPLLAGDLAKRIERIGICRFATKHLRILPRRLCEHSLPVQANRVRKQRGGGGIHGRILVGRKAVSKKHSGAASAMIRLYRAIGSTRKLRGLSPRRCISHMVE